MKSVSVKVEGTVGGEAEGRMWKGGGDVLLRESSPPPHPPSLTSCRSPGGGAGAVSLGRVHLKALSNEGPTPGDKSRKREPKSKPRKLC